MVGAKANGKIVPINHEIKTGEVIEILTTNQAGHGPSRDWLNIAVTNSAKAKIRSWFKREKRAENIEQGKAELERELRRNNISFGDKDYEEYIDDLAKRMRFADSEEFYAAIGYGGLLISKILPRMREDYNKRVTAAKSVDIATVAPKKQASSEGVIVEGIDNCLIKLSKCCAPLPGDDIIGFITRGHGVSIHKCDCSNVPRDIAKCDEPERWINAHWDKGYKEHFVSTLQITALDREGLVNDVLNTAYNMRLAVHAISAKQLKDGNCVALLTISAESVEHLRSIISRMGKITGVFSVERVVQ